MHSIFVFETDEFVFRTKPLFCDRYFRADSWVPADRLLEWYSWMFGFILAEKWHLPISPRVLRNVTMESIFNSEAPAIMNAIDVVISPDERRLLPFEGQLSYIFNGKQLFIFTCSPV